MVVKSIKRRLKLLIRRAVDAAAREPGDAPTTIRDPGQDDVAYPWLNSILVKIAFEDRRLFGSPYVWGVVHGTHLAKALGIGRISVIEFGVAGGNGMVSLERVAERVEKILGVGIDVHGFDTGSGLPKPQDYRDLPNLYTENAYPMDVAALKRRLKRGQVHLGMIEKTVPEFIRSQPAPVAFVSFDVDYYSSTMHAFQLLEADQALLLPRIHCYFDDILGFTCSEFTGERLAISEFNERHQSRKISPIFGLRYFLPSEFRNFPWSEMMYLAHIFDHNLYNTSDGLVRRIAGGITDLEQERAQ